MALPVGFYIYGSNLSSLGDLIKNFPNIFCRIPQENPKDTLPLCPCLGAAGKRSTKAAGFGNGELGMGVWGHGGIGKK